MKYLRRLFYVPAWSIAVKLSAGLVGAALIPMGFTTYYNLQQSLGRVEASESRELELSAVGKASRLDQLMIDIQRTASQLSTERYVVTFLASPTNKARKAFHASMQSSIDNIFRSSSDYDAIFLIDKQGRCLASTNPKFIGQNYASQDYFRQAVLGQPYVSSILGGETTANPGLLFANPVRSKNGEMAGVAVLKIKGADIWAIVNDLQEDSHSYGFLIDKRGVVISHPDKSFIYRSLTKLHPGLLADKRYGPNEIKSLNMPELARAMVGAQKAGHTSYYLPQEQTQQIVGFAPLEMQPWVLGVNKPRVVFTAPLNQLIWENSRSVLVVGTITAVMALLLARSISRPIYALTQAAQALEREDFEPRALELHNTLTKVSHSQDDIGQLVRVFIQMAEKVIMREQKLKQQVMELHIVIDEAKKARQVAEITGTEYFQQLHNKAQKLKSRRTIKAGEFETEYFQQLHNKAQKLKGRAVKPQQSQRSLAATPD